MKFLRFHAITTDDRADPPLAILQRGRRYQCFVQPSLAVLPPISFAVELWQYTPTEYIPVQGQAITLWESSDVAEGQYVLLVTINKLSSSLNHCAFSLKVCASGRVFSGTTFPVESAYSPPFIVVSDVYGRHETLKNNYIHMMMRYRQQKGPDFRTALLKALRDLQQMTPDERMTQVGSLLGALTEHDIQTLRGLTTLITCIREPTQTYPYPVQQHLPPPDAAPVGAPVATPDPELDVSMYFN